MSLPADRDPNAYSGQYTYVSDDASIAIGDEAWIAADAFVGPGVRVGEGAVLAARGVAFDDLEPWTIYRGNPAERLRAREFDGR